MGPLISDQHLERQRREHEREPGEGPHEGAYGVSGHKWAEIVLRQAERVRAYTILDYGAGKGTLKEALAGRIPVVNYDPVTFPIDPTAAGLVVCTDVLPFVEKDYLPNVLDHIKKLAVKGVFIVVPFHPEHKGLEGQRPLSFWSKYLRKWWPDADAQFSGTTLHGQTMRLEFRGRC